MNHEIIEEGKAIVVALEGDVDLSSSPDARKVLLESVRKGRPVIVDMAGVSYIDSSGVASLVEALQGARKAGSEFSLAAVSEPALRVLRLARLDTVFTIHESREAALGEID
jgi:anti-sigma B factor antagonist